MEKIAFAIAGLVVAILSYNKKENDNNNVKKNNHYE